jgi:DNA-binding response OmpR family regulator
MRWRLSVEWGLERQRPTMGRSPEGICATLGNGSVRYFFEDYAFDTDRRELQRGTDVVPTTPQVFDLLDYLIRNRERVVSKDDLVSAIWKGRIVSDAALTTRLKAAKRDRRFRRRTTSYQNTATQRFSFCWRRA